MLMGKNNSITWLLMVAVVSTPFLAFNFMDLQLFGVCKTMFITTWTSIHPWLCPPYVYILLNFIIFFIAASSSSSFLHRRQQSPASDQFIETSLVNSQSLPSGFSSGGELEVTRNASNHGSTGDQKVVEKKKELRKSETFSEGDGRVRARRDKYVKILSQDELNRRVEAFICKFNKEAQNGI